jgi:hypothetical protein
VTTILFFLFCNETKKIPTATSHHAREATPEKIMKKFVFFKFFFSALTFYILFSLSTERGFLVLSLLFACGARAKEHRKTHNHGKGKEKNRLTM